MTQHAIALTAVFLKSTHGYIGFVEELPGLNSHGRTPARTMCASPS
jgi:predicted RNase H-like HicB family nuclease